MTWLASWMFNPLMLGLGAAAILSPIIIHLLNKRRFKIVDWAAMDFLFDADKKNRRRVKLENFILLLLRCLAMLFLGFLLARPFLPSEFTFGQSQQFQRVILLDDSLSQRVVVGNQSAFETARDRLKQLLQMLASDGGSDFLTLYLTSKPAEPVITNDPITPDSLDALISRIDELECSDQVADYTAALTDIASFVENDRSTNNQVVYVMTDLRRQDWQNPEMTDSENTPNRLVGRINQSAPNTFVVDVGSSLEENLAVTAIRADDLLVAGTVIRFNVSVTNFGDTTAENVELRFRVDDFQPQIETVTSIAPGRTESVTFRHLFQYDRREFNEMDATEQLQDNLMNARVQVEIVQNSGLKDFLPQDSESFFAARTLRGIPVLIVDGDPSAESERSESHYLREIGVTGTGIIADTATVGEFEDISLSKYKVIFLCNVDEASPDRVESLKLWVADGGGLVFMPGDRVRASTFNETFFEDGEGLSPLKLEVMEGDVTRGDWIYMEIKDARHPALRVTLDDEIGFDQVEIFSWWRGSVKTDQAGVTVATPLSLSNEDGTPAMADRVYGDGRTVAFAFPADADWTMWPADPTYVCVMWDLVNDMVGKSDVSAGLRVGSMLRELVDLSQFSPRVALTDPRGEKVEANARPIDESQENVLYEVEFENIDRRGFYEMELSSELVTNQKRLLAVNVDAREGDLKRLDVAGLAQNFFGDSTQMLTADEMVLKNESSTSNEIWPQILLLLACCLALEQFLGWWFGRSR
ncbi:MAG: BatA domain-containing protein [Pirellulaceae bacterium]